MPEESPYTIRCPNCALRVSKGAQTCSHCGADLNNKKKTKKFKGTGFSLKNKNEKVSPTIAIVLAILFGPFGYLYLKKYAFFGGFLVGQFILLTVITFLLGPGGVSAFVSILISVFYIYHQYTLANKINQEARTSFK